MTRHSTRFRFAFALFVAAQLLLPAAASWADARENAADHTRWSGRVHVESKSSSDCGRVHPEDCALCQFATHVATPTATVKFALLEGYHAAVYHGELTLQPSLAASLLPLPRAPPLS